MINTIRKIYNNPLVFERLRKGRKLGTKQQAEVLKLWQRSGVSPARFEDDNGLPAKSVRNLAVSAGLV